MFHYGKYFNGGHLGFQSFEKKYFSSNSGQWKNIFLSYITTYGLVFGA